MFLIPVVMAGIAGWKYGVWRSETLLTIFGISLAISVFGMVLAGGIGSGATFIGILALRTGLMVLAYRIGCQISPIKQDQDEIE